MKNQDIYNYTQKINHFFEESYTKILPAKMNFIIQKNKLILNSNYELMENTRRDVILKYGSYNKTEDSYNFTEESKNLANKELKELMDLDQDVNISKIKLSDLEGLEFTLEQMEALMFMIEED